MCAYGGRSGRGCGGQTLTACRQRETPATPTRYTPRQPKETRRSRPMCPALPEPLQGACPPARRTLPAQEAEKANAGYPRKARYDHVDGANVPSVRWWQRTTRSKDMKKPGDGCRDSPAIRRRGEVPETPQPRTRDIGGDAGAIRNRSGAQAGRCAQPPAATGGGRAGRPGAPRPRSPRTLFAGVPHGGGCGGRAPRSLAWAHGHPPPRARRIVSI